MDIVSLLDCLLNGLVKAEDEFLQNPTDFYSFEQSVKSSTEAFAAHFLGEVLTDVNNQIRKSGWREGRYNIQRTDRRTLITSVGDVTFDNTYFKCKTGSGSYTYLLDDMIGLDKHERFSEGAEAALLTEALKTSYEEATHVLPSKQKITKTTVMNKVHQLAETMPAQTSDELKQVDYLFIEADEDHIAEQHGDSSVENKSFISKLVYLYEEKRPVEGYKDRKELVGQFYFSGLYPEKEGNEKLWKEVRNYIEANYDTEHLKRIFISGDGAAWIKSGVNYIDNALFCADKYHLMQYINAAARQMLDEQDKTRDELWHILYSKKPKARERFDAYTAKIMASAPNPDTVKKLRSYVLGNWAAVRRTLKNKLVDGCSAESHVSHVLSDRMSSRPMGWSQTGADRMSKLRCYERNHGRDGIIDFVRYSRRQRKQGATGTDGISEQKISVREILNDHYDQARSYIDRMQAHIDGETVRKTLAIRNRLSLL